MSDEKNKLFSEPIITSGDKFDQDYTIDNNGFDFNPNEESLYPDDSVEEPTLLQPTQEIPTKSLDDETKVIPPSSSTSSDHRSYNTGDIFQTEPINNYQEAPIEKQNNYYTVNQKPDQDDYEDEPETSNTKWWILGGIALVVLICLGWFVFARMPSQAPPAETKVEETEKTVEEIPEETENTEDENRDDSSNSNNSYQNNNSSSVPSGNTSNGGGSSSGGLSNSSDNAGYDNNSSSGSQNQTTTDDSSSNDTTYDNTDTGTSEDTSSEDTVDSDTTDSSTVTTEQTDSPTNQETQEYNSEE